MQIQLLPSFAAELVAWLQTTFPQAAESAIAAAALTAQRADEGHVCVDLHAEANQRFQGIALPSLASWRADLLASGFVATPGGFAPLILDEHRLYLARLWVDETCLARELGERAGPTEFAPEDVKAALASLFAGDHRGDGQYRAAATALLSRVAIIAGGPGTGKTTTVAKVLVALQRLAPEAQICLAAPTGKAAARMMEALNGAKQRLGLDLVAQAALPNTATTLHRLLGYRPDSAAPRHDADNPLVLDVLVVDEASMIDLALFSRLLQALPPRTQLILLGDRDQLASVEAGSAFSEILSVAGHTANGATRLAAVLGEPVAADTAAVPLADGIAVLTQSHRFNEQNGIGAMARAANAGDAALSMQLLANPSDEIRWQGGRYQTWLPTLLAELAPQLARYQAAVASGDPQRAMVVFNQLRLLCAVREGTCGVDAINRLIETQLMRHDSRRQPWYAGRPVMVRANDAAVGLANGDIGITLATPEGLRVAFPDGLGWRWLTPARLPRHDTAFAMTVHQSQGSEFTDVWLLLPDEDVAVLSRSLIYTAITRARQRLAIWGSATTLTAAITRQQVRISGLQSRLARVAG